MSVALTPAADHCTWFASGRGPLLDRPAGSAGHPVQRQVRIDRDRVADGTQHRQVRLAVRICPGCRQIRSHSLGIVVQPGGPGVTDQRCRDQTAGGAPVRPDCEPGGDDLVEQRCQRTGEDLDRAGQQDGPVPGVPVLADPADRSRLHPAQQDVTGDLVDEAGELVGVCAGIARVHRPDEMSPVAPLSPHISGQRAGELGEFASARREALVGQAQPQIRLDHGRGHQRPVQIEHRERVRAADKGVRRPPGRGRGLFRTAESRGDARKVDLL